MSVWPWLNWKYCNYLPHLKACPESLQCLLNPLAKHLCALNTFYFSCVLLQLWALIHTLDIVCRSYGWCWNSLHSRARWLGGAEGRKLSSSAAAAVAVSVPAKQRSIYPAALWQNGWASCRRIACFISVRRFWSFPSLWWRFSDRSASRPPSRGYFELQQASFYDSLAHGNKENIKPSKPQQKG